MKRRLRFARAWGDYQAGDVVEGEFDHVLTGLIDRQVATPVGADVPLTARPPTVAAPPARRPPPTPKKEIIHVHPRED